MPISFKSKLSSSVANATFLDKTIDDLKKGKLGLYKVTSTETGAIQDVQVFINELADASGVTGEGDATRKTYSSTNYISNGDNRKVAIGKLDSSLLTANNRITSVENDINTTQELVKEPTGFPNRTDTTLAFNEVSRQFTIAPIGASFDVHIKGTKYTKTSESIVIADTDGNHYIYYDSTGLLSETTTFSPSLFENNALVSIIYWNTSNQKAAYFADERHGLVMDGATHGYLHTVFGARYLSGLGLQGFSVDGDGSLDAHAQFQADSGTIRDEDLVLTSALTSSIPVLYRSGLLWRKKTADSFPLIYNGTAGYTGTNIAYNEFTGGAWQLTEVINNNYVLIHVFATNDYQTPIIAILGTASHPNVPAARLAADSEISSISGLPFAEFVAVGSVIFKTNSAYTNTPKAAVVSASAGENYVDFRGEQLYTPSGVATSHSLLSNLSSDDHLQYFNESRGDARYVRNGASVGAGEPVFKQKSGTDLQFKSIVAGSNVTLTPGTDTLTIAATDTGESNTASNVGTGDGVFKQKTGVNLEFKSLVAGSNVTITPGNDSLTISSTDTGEVNTASNLGATGEGVFAAKVGADLQFRKLIPGTNVTFSSNGESITINAAGGASTMAGTITQTQKTVGTSAVRATVSGSAPSATRKKLVLKPSKNNTGSIFIGSSAVTTANGMEIIGPDRLEIQLDASDYYLISDTAGQLVEILEID
jgi:hypothetical protein